MHGECAGCESDGRHPSGIEDVSRNHEEVQIVVHLRPIGLAGEYLSFRTHPAGVAHQQPSHRRHDSWQTHHPECRPPSDFLAERASKRIPQCSSQWQGQVVKSHRSAALTHWKQVGDQGRRDHAVARFTDSQQRSPEKDVPEISRQRGSDGCEAP